jgi:hypothetical protein
MDLPNRGRVLYMASWLGIIYPVGRSSGMNLCRRRLGVVLDLLVNIRVRMGMRLILPLWLREI